MANHNNFAKSLGTNNGEVDGSFLYNRKKNTWSPPPFAYLPVLFAHLTNVRRSRVSIGAVLARPKISVIQRTAGWPGARRRSLRLPHLAGLSSNEVLRARALATSGLIAGRSHVLQPSLECSNKVFEIVPGHTGRELDFHEKGEVFILYVRTIKAKGSDDDKT